MTVITWRCEACLEHTLVDRSEFFLYEEHVSQDQELFSQEGGQIDCTVAMFIPIL